MYGRCKVRGSGFATNVPGPATGIDKVTLSEPDGLHSGIWEQTAEANILASAVAATLTAQPTATASATPIPTATPTPDWAATQISKTQALAIAVAATLTAAPTPTPVAGVYGFTACLELCAADRSNARRTFPEGVKKIYLEWNFANIPIGARYTRVWTLQSKGEWVRYQCTWPGNWHR